MSPAFVAMPPAFAAISVAFVVIPLALVAMSLALGLAARQYHQLRGPVRRVQVAVDLIDVAALQGR